MFAGGATAERGIHATTSSSNERPGRATRKSSEKACGWKHPRASPIKILSQDDRVAPVVLIFLRETKVEMMINLVPPAEKEEGEGGGREELLLLGASLG